MNSRFTISVLENPFALFMAIIIINIIIIKSIIIIILIYNPIIIIMYDTGRPGGYPDVLLCK